MKKYVLLMLLPALILAEGTAQAERFSGGVCQTQGSWLQTALDQSEVINNAIQVLQNDPNCQTLVKILATPVDLSSDETLQAANSSFVDVHSDLSSISTFLKGQKLKGSRKPILDSAEARNILYNVLLRKSNDAIGGLKGLGYYNNLNQSNQQIVNQVTGQLDQYVKLAKVIAKTTMLTTQNILAAYPQNRMCFHNNPSQTLSIFSYAVSSVASLISGGQDSGISQFVGSLLTFARDMNYMDAKVPGELEKFRASVSCLVESTSEKFCALQDASDALDFMKENGGVANFDDVLESAKRDVSQSPIGGMVLQLRDAPILSEWMQRVLFGVDPKLEIDATMKNDNWDSFVGYVKGVNTLKSIYSSGVQDYEELYKDDTTKNKLDSVRALVQKLKGNMEGLSRAKMNFFGMATDGVDVGFYLLGRDTNPDGFNDMDMDFNVFWDKWVADGTYNDPDRLVVTIGRQLDLVIARAGQKANAVFNSRMLTDPQNLVAEALKGPGISPYEAMLNLRAYVDGLDRRFSMTVEKLGSQPEQFKRLTALQSVVSLLRDTRDRLDRMTGAIQGLPQKIELARKAMRGKDSVEQQATMADINRDVLNIIYDAGDMLVTRDAFLPNRLTTIIQYDVTETLHESPTLTDRQSDLLASMGSNLLDRLIVYFGVDPIVERLDQSQAMILGMKNLEAVETLFAKTYYAQIEDLNCQLTGDRRSCRMATNPIQPAKPNILDSIYELFGAPARGPTWRWEQKQDAAALEILRAKLCIQTLSFESRDKFQPICKGAVLVSEFATLEKDPSNLNMSYDETLALIKSTAKSGQKYSLNGARVTGVCALRTYLRKNQIFQMYDQYSRQH